MESPPMTIAATAENLKAKHLKEDWTVVLPRRGRQRRSDFPNIKSHEQQQPQPWAPTDLETDLRRESKLVQKMHIHIKNLENTKFYHNFLNQIQTPQIRGYFSRVLGSESKMQMVIYGIGSIESYETPRLQLSLAILMKRKFDWIGDIKVFDPVLSTTEMKVVESLGCCVLTINEQGRRQALKPTMFFMPHCEAVLYDNLLQANWKAELLNKMVLFGNSFERYEQYVAEFKNPFVVGSSKYVLGARRFIKEVAIETHSDDLFRAFHDSSWHFFDLDPEMELQAIKS